MLTQTGYDHFDSLPAGGPNGNLATTHINSNHFITSYNATPSYAQAITKTRVSSWYINDSNTPNSDYEAIITDLIDVFAGQAGSIGKVTSNQIDYNSDQLNSAVEDYLRENENNFTTGKPIASVNWILFDEQFTLVNSGSGFDEVGDDKEFKVHLLNGIEIPENGYLFVFVSNTDQNIPVYFDNLQSLSRTCFGMTHIRGPILEETHYYPFGLTMAGISTKALSFGSPENKIKFQGQEFATKEFSDGSGIDMYEFKWRMHDPQIGRFWQIDPLSDKYVYNSTYAFSENKVISHVELEGLEARLAIAGSGTNTSYKPEDVNAFDARAKNLEKTAGFTASQVHTGNQIVDKLKEGTTSEGSVGAVVIFAHTSQDGVYLDKEDGLYTGSDWYGGANSANVAEIKSGVDAGEIKFDKNAVIVMGGCNCGKNDGTISLAESMTQELGVIVYAADGNVYPEVVNGKETGKLKTDGTFRMYQMTPERTIEIPGYGNITVPAGVGTTNVGKTIDPAKLVPPKPN